MVVCMLARARLRAYAGTPFLPAGAARTSGFTHAAEPRPDGLDAHGPARTAPNGYPRMAAYLRGACARRRRRSWSPAASRPTSQAGSRPSRSQHSPPARAAQHRIADHGGRCMPRAARSRCRSCTPAATPITRWRWRLRRCTSPITPLHAARAHRRRRRADDPPLRRAARARARRPATTASR